MNAAEEASNERKMATRDSQGPSPALPQSLTFPMPLPLGLVGAGRRYAMNIAQRGRPRPQSRNHCPQAKRRISSAIPPTTRYDGSNTVGRAEAMMLNVDRC